MERPDLEFRFQLLLNAVPVGCRYFTGDEEVYKLSEDCDSDCHVACNCDGDINRCDLPEEFQNCLV